MQQPQPHVSVVIPLFNRINLIQETLSSLKAQTYQNWEGIVVDDGSTDGSYDLVKKIAQQDSRIKLIKRHREPKGAPTCRNIGAELAAGKYLVFLDSDDLLASFCIEQRLNYFQTYPDYDFLVFPMLMFEKNPYDLSFLWNVPTKEDNLTRFLRMDAVWQTTCPIYKKDSFQKFGGFDENLSYWQDFELHIRILSKNHKYKIVPSAQPDCFYRKHEMNTISQTRQLSHERLKYMIQIYQKIYQELKINNSLSKERLTSVRSMYFWFSLQWILQFQDIEHSLHTWNYSYKNTIEKTSNYIFGFLHLCLKFLHMTIRKNRLAFLILSKLFILMLPPSYRRRKLSIGKVGSHS